MRTRSSSNLVGNYSSNPTTTNPKRRNRRRSNQRVKPFALEESPVVTMADQRTMAKLLRAPTEGYAEAIVVPPILTEHFELKHSLINMMTSDQFFRLEKDHPHDHIRCDGNSSSSNIAKLTHAINQQTSAVTTVMTAILKHFQATPPPASIKAVEEICVTYGGAHPYYQSVVGNYNQGNSGYRPPGVANQTRPPGFVQQNSNTVANPRGELKAITTRSGLVLDGPTIPMPPPFINPEEDERVEETLTDPDHGEYTIKVPPSQVQKAKPPS
ncbi:hypothetical protein Tco_0850270 [Tanacetum coccineum]